jgi:2-polyprenyl-3-methyl-5-hydroxy-6-metoxy-1,4-benzoquinol methylase
LSSADALTESASRPDLSTLRDNKRTMPAEEVFEEEFFASLYDSVNPWSASDDFYAGQAIENGGPVLDLGCGTGMLACSLAARNLNVTGVDPSKAMLRIARTRPGGDKVNWIQSDGQSLRLQQRFNFIYMTGHAFQQLLTDDDAVGLLRVAAEHLNSDGRFVFETRNPAAQAWLSWTPEHSSRTLQLPQHGLVRLFHDAQAEPTTGIVTIREHYHLLDSGVQRVGRNRIRFLSQEHVARLLTNAGLVAIAWHGDWAGGPFLPTSNEIIVVTHRATGASPTRN